MARRELYFNISDTREVSKGCALSTYWSCHQETSRNFGDAINPVIVKYLTGREVVHSDRVFSFGPWSTFFFVGSILDNLSRPNAVVFGSGFMYQNARIYRKPRAVIAVRGPATRRILLDAGVHCPPIYCDPGLLVSKIVPVNGVEKKWDVGILPHYADKEIAQALRLIDSGLTYKWIDIENNHLEVVEEINSCRCILASSLHGIITAHAYGIPSVWVRFSNKIGGAGFKFADYYASLGVQAPVCYEASASIDLAKARDLCTYIDPSENIESLLSQVPLLEEYI